MLFCADSVFVVCQRGIASDPDIYSGCVEMTMNLERIGYMSLHIIGDIRHNIRLIHLCKQ